MGSRGYTFGQPCECEDIQWCLAQPCRWTTWLLWDCSPHPACQSPFCNFPNRDNTFSRPPAHSGTLTSSICMLALWLELLCVSENCFICPVCGPALVWATQRIFPPSNGLPPKLFWQGLNPLLGGGYLHPGLSLFGYFLSVLVYPTEFSL